MSLSLTPLTLHATPQPAPAPVLAPSQTTSKHAMTDIRTIPSAVFGRILSFFPAREITCTFHHVCKDWRNLSLVNDGCLDLSGLRNLSDSDLKTILDKASGARITSINLSNCTNITDVGLAHLSKLTSLSSLNLRGCKITDTGLAYVAKLTSLSSLNLDWCTKITDAGLAHLSKLTLLSSLNLSMCYTITDAGLAHLSKLTLLSSLNLCYCENITDAGLAHLSKLTLLSSLYLSGCKNISDAGLAHLSTLTLLSSLGLYNCTRITDTGLDHLSKLTLLSSLYLYRCYKITDAGLAHLSKLTLLSSLYLNSCYQITDAGLAHLATLTFLTLLHLDDSGVSLDAAKAFKAKLIPVAFKDAAFRDRMDYYIYMLAPQPKGGDEWAGKNRYVDLDRLKLAQALANLELSRPELFKELSIAPLLDIINQQSSTDQLDQSLQKLPKETKNAIFYQVYQLAPEPKEGDQWGEKHRFDDLARFRLAVIEVIKSLAFS